MSKDWKVKNIQTQNLWGQETKQKKKKKEKKISDNIPLQVMSVNLASIFDHLITCQTK